MSISKCEICERNIYEYKCRVCERRVCREDFDLDTGICVTCKETLCSICRERLSIGICKHCGRIACEECLIQVSLIEYICVDCFRKGLR